MRNTLQKRDGKIFSHPFSAGYWRLAAGELNYLQMGVLAAMLVALAVAINTFQLQITPLLRVKFVFLVTAVGAMIYGPVVAMLAGVATDIVGYLIAPFGAFFPGYTLSALLSGLVYALFLYRAKISPLRIFAAKLIVNVFINSLLGSLWRVAMDQTQEKGYLVHVTTSFIKNILLLPLEVTLLTVLIGAVAPFLVKKRILPDIGKVRLSQAFIMVSILVSVACLLGLIYCLQNLSIFAK